MTIFYGMTGKIRKYRYRNFPCTITSDEKLWCVSGRDIIDNSAGILEWCFDAMDAKEVFLLMQASGDFKDLEYNKYKKKDAGV